MTSDGIPCPEPDCDGVIEDGYCTVTGLAYRPPPNAIAAAAAAGFGSPTGGRPTGAGTDAGSAAESGAGGSSGSSAGTGGDGSGQSSWGSRSGRSRRTRPTGPSRGAATRLGAGLVDIPDVAVPEPTSLLLTDPQVPESRRICSRCAAPVGRARGDEPASVEGFCVACGQPFSFVPTLRAGDRIGQYEIAGALAHGGQGWVYLARDRGVSENFWVVLKGLLDEGDPDAQAAAIAERRFLASVDHSAIVRIYTFVEHAGTGYIVMEYIGGTSLREVLRRRRTAAGRPDPLPVAQAIAYLLAVLPAFAYLHRNGLVFCDFKPDNVMLGEETVRLIDLGAVRRLDDGGGAVYGTRGYQAPEVAEEGPSVASDLFTVGRTLAALILDFRGNTSTYRFALPPAADHQVLARYESLYRFLRKATAALPEDRFGDAEEMREELLGVLREVVAAERGAPVPAPSRRFTGDIHLTGENADGTVGSPPWATLPRLRVDSDDPAAATLLALPDSAPDQLAGLLEAISPATAEVRLRLARARMEQGDAAAAHQVLAELSAEDPFEWRVDWYRGLLALTADDPPAARAAFERVYDQAPGELAPKLALALAAEAEADGDGDGDGDRRRAEQLFDLVSGTDDSFTSAAFGLARVRMAGGDRDGAVAAYQRVPSSSAAHLDARMRLARVLGTTTTAGTPGREEILAASRILASLDLDPGRRAALARDLLGAALDLVHSGTLSPDPGVIVAGAPLRAVDLRLGLERAYLDLARLAPSPGERYALVDLANHVRPRTLL